MSNYLGDFNVAQMIDLKFTTVNTSGVPTTLAGSPAISVYKANGTTQSTAGVTLTVDFDGVTGLHHVRIDTSADGTFYAAFSDLQVVITTGTVSGSSVVGYVVGAFSLANRLVDAAGVTTLLARLGAFSGTGTNTALGFLQAIMRNDVTLPSDIGGTYDDATDSLQALEEGQPFVII